MKYTSSPPEVNSILPAAGNPSCVDIELSLLCFAFSIASAAASKSNLSRARAASDIALAAPDTAERSPP